ncbi:hypothetical protein SADUNF_Sadunf06G0186600 [Salix dunnii]|uniref:RING-type E3 ubiquitin transferase n=1 Tax=Salix dunnii TaxID=1413687 RepID=A0A835K2Y4_9ROSI|nr:hypothetical protein SADUNF_Sadunf06G0186600 [Salix dunnii]
MLSSAGVAVFFRAVSPLETQYVVAMRSRFSNMTAVAGGIRKSSTGQLYMVGCLGIVDSEGNTCNSRICLYIPLSFSIRQHSIIFGSFCNASRINDSFFPSELWNYFRNSHPYFSHSQIEKAGDTKRLKTGPSHIAEDLTPYSSAFPDPLPRSPPRTAADFQIEVLSLGSMDVRASWNVLFESMDVEAGLDCLNKAIVSYPPTTALWLVIPTATISISSQRNEDDLLYFSTVKLRTLPIMYRGQREDILSLSGAEGVLRILTLSFAIGCISSQLFYINHELDSVPFISLLGVQALGYSLPLITGAEAFLNKRKASESYESSTYYLEKNQWLNVIDYVVTILVMVAFLVTLKALSESVEISYQITYKKPLYFAGILSVAFESLNHQVFLLSYE